MTPYYESKLGELLQTDCRSIPFPDNHFTGVITDPPYELGFMGKKWDSSGVAFQVETWVEILRVCKPGAMLMAFGGTRTSHRLVCAIEDAGWEIRDCMMWIYGSGFPKSSDISKNLDKDECRKQLTQQFGRKPTKEEFETVWKGFREIISETRTKSGGMANVNKENLNQGFRPNNYNEHGNIFQETVPVTGIAKQFDGYGTSLKPAYEPIVIAMKPLYEPALDIYQAVMYTLRNNGLEDVKWEHENALHAERSSDKRTSTETPQPKTGGTSAKTANAKEMLNTEQGTKTNCSNVQENGIQITRDGQTSIGGIIQDDYENQSSKPMGPSANAAGKRQLSSSPSTISTTMEKNTDPLSDTPTYTATYGNEDSQKTGLDYYATTVIALEAVTESALTIKFKNKTYRINKLGNNVLVWPEDLPKFLPRRALTFANNALVHGVAGLNIDAGRVGTEIRTTKGMSKKQPEGAGTFRDDNWIPKDIETISKGRWPANIILSHHPDCECVGVKKVKNTSGSVTGKEPSKPAKNVYGEYGRHEFQKHGDLDGTETVEAWNCHPDCPIFIMDSQSGERPGMSGGGAKDKLKKDTWAIQPFNRQLVKAEWIRNDTGGASRFFYTAKASRSERGKDNDHPTVKPVALIRYLVELTAPPKDALILDPFMGSGTLGVVCEKLGIKYVGIDLDCRIAKERIERETSQQRLPGGF